MAELTQDQSIPEGYVHLSGSERHPSKTARLLGPADSGETFEVSIVLRRRTDGPPVPDFDYFANTPPSHRRRLEPDEFAEKYGAHPEDVRRVVQFAEKAGLQVVGTYPARRTVVVSGTVSQMNKAFAVTLGRYQHTIDRHHGKKTYPFMETYRGRDGSIGVPAELAECVVGVFGLDNRTITKRNLADPPNTHTVTVEQVTQLYKFPTNSAAGQAIGIISPTGGLGGYFQKDLQLCFGASMPTVTPVSVDGVNNGCIELVTTAPTAAGGLVLTFASTAGILVWSWPYSPALTVANPNDGVWVTAVTPTTVKLNQAVTAAIPAGTHILFNPDGETTQDICIAAKAAPGADVAVFFSNGDQQGWVDLIHRAINPQPGDPVCSVLTSSFYMSNGDDAATMADEYLTTAAVNAISAAFQDAAIQGLTVCIASGDNGSNSKVGRYVTSVSPLTYGGDGKAHVQYPGSDPNVLSVGGTTIGNIAGNPPTCDEYVWNDPNPASLSQWGTTGGGVSDFFPRPSYQLYAAVPPSVNDPTHIGRGVPDVAGNASFNSGYSGLYCAGEPFIGNGTSASAPLWAGLIAVINAALGEHVGFINPSIYKFGSPVFRDMNPPPGPTDNSNNTIAGYPAGPGWDACTGWGSPNGVALLAAFKTLPAAYICGGYQSADVILSDPATNLPIPIGGTPGGPWDTLLAPSTNYPFSAVVHNNSHTAASNVVVRFWAIPGGVGCNGTMVGVPKTVTVPAYGSVTIPASAPFTSAPAGDHMCAVVSIYSPSTGCSTDATTAVQIPDPGLPGTHGCSAWRNTDSMWAQQHAHFGFTLGLGVLHAKLKEPIVLQIDPVHVPAAWHQTAKAKEVASVLKFVGADPGIPLYLVPDLYKTLPQAQLKTKVTVKAGGEIKDAGAGKWHLLPSGRGRTTFEVSGEIPATAKRGEIVLVKVAANYPPMEGGAARRIEFLEFIHVTDKIRT